MKNSIETYFTGKKLLVSHFPQVPCKAFNIQVENEVEAYRLVSILAQQHLFLERENIIPDYANIISVSVWDENADGEGNAEWVNWVNEEQDLYSWEEFEEILETKYSELMPIFSDH